VTEINIGLGEQLLYVFGSHSLRSSVMNIDLELLSKSEYEKECALARSVSITTID
jgi:hypothetical protein